MAFAPNVAVFASPKEKNDIAPEVATVVPPQSPPPGYPIHLDPLRSSFTPVSPPPPQPAAQPAPLWMPSITPSTWIPVQASVCRDPEPVTDQDAFTAHRSHGVIRPHPSPSPDQREFPGDVKLPTPTNNSFRRRRCGCFRL